jgi:hypothetical protein
MAGGSSKGPVQERSMPTAASCLAPQAVAAATLLDPRFSVGLAESTFHTESCRGGTVAHP